PHRPPGLPARHHRRGRQDHPRHRSAGDRSPEVERGEGAAAAGGARALMRVWKVVVLVNLALALGLGTGWLWWGRQARRLTLELEAARTVAVPVGEREFRA